MIPWKSLAILAIVILAIGLGAMWFTVSQYKKEYSLMEQQYETLQSERDSIIESSREREEALLQDRDLDKRKIRTYKKQRDELQGEINDREQHDYSYVVDSLKLHVFDSLLTELKRAQDRFDNTVKDN